MVAIEFIQMFLMFKIENEYSDTNILILSRLEAVLLTHM